MGLGNQKPRTLTLYAHRDADVPATYHSRAGRESPAVWRLLPAMGVIIYGVCEGGVCGVSSCMRCLNPECKISSSKLWG